MADDVVLVEDDPEVSEMLVDAIEKLVGVAVSTRAGVEGVVEEVVNDPPAVILLGLSVPGGSGLVHTLKANPDTATIPVVGVYSRGLTTCADVLRSGFAECVDAGAIEDVVNSVWKYLHG